MRRQAHCRKGDRMKGKEAAERGKRRRMGRLGGEKPPSPLWFVRFLNKQIDRQRPCSMHHPSMHLRQNLICRGFSWRPEDRETEWSNQSGGGRLRARPSVGPSLAMHKTNCWHKVTQRAEQGLVGRQEESIPPSLHLSIDIPGSPSSASGFCNYNQTAASRPPKHWLTAWINRDVEKPWDAVFVCACVRFFVCVCVRVCLSVHLCV